MDEQRVQSGPAGSSNVVTPSNELEVGSSSGPGYDNHLRSQDNNKTKKGKSMNTSYRVSYGFVKVADTANGEITDAIIQAMTNNPGFPNPPYLTTLETQRTAYLTALAATAQGGDTRNCRQK